MNKWKTRLYCALLYPSLLSLTSPILANSNAAAGPWTPRVVGWGMGGNQNQAAGYVDGLIPILGDYDYLFYLDGNFGAGRYNRYFGGLGSGVRQIRNVLNHEAIIGAFAFAEIQQTRHRNQTWIMNPGVELLTNHTEFRAQCYFPTVQNAQIYYNSMASNYSQLTLNQYGLDINNLYYGSGHQFFDTPVALAEEFGPGVELSAGFFIPFSRGVWARGTFYHYGGYDYAHSINGGGINLEFFASKNISVIVQDNYDNQFKNQFGVGVQLSFGGPDQTQVETLSNRMEELINRHLARRTYGQAIPTRDVMVVTGDRQVSIDNVWFFKPEGVPAPTTLTTENCTAEHPCQNINQSTTDQINVLAPNANLFFASGAYVLPQQTNQPQTGRNGWITLSNGQVVWGRSHDFRRRAQDDERPTITGGLFWGNVANNITGNGTIYDFKVVNMNQVIPARITGAPTIIGDSVIAVGANQNIQVDNTAIYTSVSRNNTSTVGVFGGQNAMVSNSSLNTTASGNATINSADARAYGIFANNDAALSYSRILTLASGNANTVVGINFARALGIQTLLGNVAVKNSMISAQTTGSGGIRGNTEAFGVFVATGTSSVVNSFIQASTSSNSLSAFGLASASGVISGGPGTLVNSTVIATTTGSATNGGSVSATAFSPGAGISPNQIINSLMIATTYGNASGGGTANALSVTNPLGSILLTNSVARASTFGTATTGGTVNAVGITFPDVTLQNTLVSVNAVNPGSALINQVTIMNATNSVCYVNGVVISCGP